MSARAEPPPPEGMSESAGNATTVGEARGDRDDRGRSGAATARAPDFFIVGHEKCGTTALYEMLRGHPQVFMPDFKEPRFFSPDTRVRALTPSNVRRPRTLEAYLELFAPARPEQRVGEASPQYLRSRVAPERIAELQPQARIIAILREPVSFLRSFHMQNIKGNLETERDLRAAMALEEDRRQGKRLPRGSEFPVRLLYSEHVRYLEQLHRFEAAFPSSQILVLIYEDYLRHNEATVRSVWRFLDVDDTLPVEVVNTRQPRKAVRSMPLHKLTRAVKLARHRPDAANPLARAVYAVTPRPAVEMWRRIVYTHPDRPDEAFSLELRRRFKPEVEALGEHLGRDLVSLWGYDRV